MWIHLKNTLSIFKSLISELLVDDNYSFYNYENKNKGDINNLVINQLSENLIEQFEKRITDKDTIIGMQKETISLLNNTIIQLQEVIASLKK